VHATPAAASPRPGSVGAARSRSTSMHSPMREESCRRSGDTPEL
jgi:hypothetical protein